MAWYFNDHLGTPLRQADAAGRVVWHAEYEPYGSVYGIVRGEGRHQPLRFPGQESADGGDLEYNIFRWYRAGWGRYTQSDPIGLQGGMNLYRYADANPISFLDSLGLKVCRCTRRMDNPLSALSWTIDPISRHEFVQIVPDGHPCGGFDGVAFGFQAEAGGRVRPERTPTFNPQLRCTAVPCIDEDKLRRQINSDIHHPPRYAVATRIPDPDNPGLCLWNARNCQGWVDQMLRRARKEPCCSP